MKPWVKHLTYCLVIVILSLIFISYPIWDLSKNLFFAFIFSIAIIFIAIVILLGTVFSNFQHKRFLNFIFNLNNYSYSEEAPIINNITLIVVIFIYLIFFYVLFDSYLIKFKYDSVGILLLGWLALIIIRSAHYSDSEAGQKISEVISSFIFPIGFIVVIVYGKDFIDKGFQTQFQNIIIPLIPWLFIIIALSFFLEIFLYKNKKKNEAFQIEVNSKNKDIEQSSKNIVEYNETLYSIDYDQKNKKSSDTTHKGTKSRINWENAEMIEKNINNIHKKRRKSIIDKKVDNLLSNKV